MSSDDELPVDSVDECSIFDQCGFSKLSEKADQDSSGQAGACASPELPADSGMPLSGNFGNSRKSEGESCAQSEGEYGDVNYISSPHRDMANDDFDGKERFERSHDFNSYNDVADILSRLHQIRHQNCVLLEEKKKLQAQLEATEESLHQQQAQLNEWERKNRSLQNVMRENKELQKEVEELRASIDALEAVKRELQAAHSQTERDVVYWQERAEVYSNMVSKHQQELDERVKTCEDLRRSLMEHRETIEECNRLSRSQQAEIDDRAATVQNLSEMLDRLNEKSEQLAREKEEREGQLREYKEEIRKYRLSCSGIPQEGRASLPTLNHDRDGHHSLLRASEYRRKCSTPHRLESLHSELVEEMSHESSLHLPSPFCEKGSPFNDKLRHSQSFDLSGSLQSIDELPPKSLLDMEVSFNQLMASMTADNELKERCTNIFKNVLLTHQRLCVKLNSEVRQVREEKDFIQSRYQEALQQLRDTSCLLETDIADKMASLEEQIKAEQLYRVEMEAQLAKFKEEEEFRAAKKDSATQARLVPVGLTDKLPPHLNLSCFVGDEKSHEYPAFRSRSKGELFVIRNHLLRALDLASQSPRTFSSSTLQYLYANSAQTTGSSRSMERLQPVLPEFDLEFTFSFETPHPSAFRRGLTDSVCEAPSIISEEKDEDSVAAVRRMKAMKSRKLQNGVADSPTSSSFSCLSSMQPPDSSIKESDASEEREDKASTTTTASSVEDFAEPAMNETAPTTSASQPSFAEESAVPNEEVQRLMAAEETTALESAPSSATTKKRRVSLSLPGVAEEENSSVAAAPVTSSPPEVAKKVEEDDSVFADDASRSETRSRGRVGFVDSKTKEQGAPPQQQQSSVFPNLSNAKLKEMDLFPDPQQASRSWSEEEAEQKFTQLSLAFRTDRQTLEERIKLHIGGRDTAERNVKSEIETVRQIANGMSQVPNFPMEIISNLQYTCRILEQSIHRLASKSEILGAVQQEGRLNHAVDVMLHHMDNLRRTHAKDNRELEEARRILKDGRFVGSASDFTGESSMTKRSLSLIGGGSPVKGGFAKRTRMSGPEIFHFPQGNTACLSADCGHFPCSSSSTSPFLEQSLRRTSTTSRKSTLSTDSHDPRSRFQAAVHSTGIQSTVTQHLHRLSYGKISSLTSQDSVPGHHYSTNESNPNNSGSHDSNGRVTKVSSASDSGSSSISEKDVIFQKGLEQGLRAQVGNELGTLREEQSSLTESLDYLMEMHSLVEEDGEDGDSEEKSDFVDLLISKGSKFLSEGKLEISFLRARWIAGFVAFVLALFILLWSVLWSVTMKHPTSAPS